MEVKTFFIKFAFILTLGACSNTPELETGEIKTLQLLKNAINRSNSPKMFVDARQILSREKIDAAKIPVLFVELKSGQNGTLTPYPGKGLGQTWLGADGATITLDRGILKASRGMGDDIMGSISMMPPWSKINKKTEAYSRELSYITGNNKISKHVFKCDIQKTSNGEVIKIWDINFKVAKFEENCLNSSLKIKNAYYVDNQGVVRRSSQYHSDTIGYIFTERLDR